MRVFLFLLVVILILLTGLFGFFYDEIRDFIEDKTHKHRVYKVLYHFAEDTDTLLLNDCTLFLGKDDLQPTVFDHILVGKKYVYIVKDYVNHGGIYGNLQDEHLHIKNKTGKYIQIENEVLKNYKNLLKLEKVINISHEDRLFVSVVCYNNSLFVPKGIAVKDFGNWFLKIGDLEKTLKQAENDNVPPITDANSEELINILENNSMRTKQQIEQIKAERKKGNL